jgi:hypothetical protein
MKDYTRRVFSQVDKDRIEAYVLHQHLGSKVKTAKELGLTRDKCSDYIRMGGQLWGWIRMTGIDPYSILPVRCLGLSTPATILINHLMVFEVEAIRAELKRQGSAMLDVYGVGPAAVREVLAWLGEEEPIWLKYRKTPQQTRLDL